MEDVFMRLYPGGRHEMLNEANKDEVYKDILDWINSKISK
jgi:alpha-beta hydrolase superfamily lysophospholipase